MRVLPTRLIPRKLLFAIAAKIKINIYPFIFTNLCAHFSQLHFNPRCKKRSDICVFLCVIVISNGHTDFNADF